VRSRFSAEENTRIDYQAATRDISHSNKFASKSAKIHGVDELCNQ
jgi:hypothetical protein